MNNEKSKSNFQNLQFENTNSNGRIAARQNLYLYLKENSGLKITDKGNIYLREDNVYKLKSKREVISIIKEHLPVEHRTNRDWEAVWKEFMTDAPDICESDFNSDENIVGFRNGVLDLSTGELKPYNEKHIFTRIVPCNYLPNKRIEDAPIFYEYLKMLCNEDTDSMTFLLEYIGGILSNVKGWRFKKLLFLVGVGNSGKSQIRELTMNLLGRENCVSIDIKKINERFGAAQLYQRRLAGSGDMSTLDIADMAVIKEISGGDSLFAEFKGKDGFSFIYDGFLWFNANELPHFRGDRGEHVYSRFIIVQCNNVVPIERRDPKLQDKLMTEKDIISSIAIDAFKKAVDSGYKFTEGSKMMMSRKQYVIENNSLLSFVKDCCELHPECHKTKRSDFNRVYKCWCLNNRVYPERDREIGKQLEEHFDIVARKAGGYYWYRIKIKDDILKEYDEKEYTVEKFIQYPKNCN